MVHRISIADLDSRKHLLTSGWSDKHVRYDDNDDRIKCMPCQLEHIILINRLGETTVEEHMNRTTLLEKDRAAYAELESMLNSLDEAQMTTAGVETVRKK